MARIALLGAGVLAAALVALALAYPIEMGIDGNPHFWWDAPHLSYRAALGAPVTRMYFPPEKPLSEMDQHVLIAARDVRTRVHALVGANKATVSAAAYARYCVELIQRFGPKGTFWNEHPSLRPYAVQTLELMNEPYLGKGYRRAAPYARYIKPALNALKRLNSGVRVIVPTRNYASKTGGSWVNTLYKVIPNLNKLVHGVSTHPYFNGHAPNEKTNDSERTFSAMDALRANLNCHKGHRLYIYVTEYGASTCTGNSDCISEAYQVRNIKTFASAAIKNTYGWNVKMFLLYTLLDWPLGQGGEIPNNREAFFGLYRPDKSPKPSLAVAKSLMRGFNVPKRKPKSSMKGKQIIRTC